MTAKRVLYLHSDALLAAADDLPANEGRASLVHSLCSASGLLDDGAGEAKTGDAGSESRARVVAPTPATREELCRFHDSRYIDTILGRDAPSSSISEDSSDSSMSDIEPSFGLSRLSSSSLPPRKRQKTSSSQSLGLQDDCPLFPSLPSYARLVAGASITAARLLRDGEADVAISWNGGRHHGKRGEASGFCYINDIVLAIMELKAPPKRLLPPVSPSASEDEDKKGGATSPSPPPLPRPPPPKRLSRTLYIDLDLHHGDGVELAFLSTPSVLTLSIHLHAPLFFPSTGALDSTGPAGGGGAGALHALNVALEPGAEGETLERVWGSCVEKMREAYRPEAVVLQCGVDGLAGDPCKEFNLSLSSLGSCVTRALEWNLPTLLLGGGGYSHPNAARAWTYLTSVALGRPVPLDSSLPSSLSSADYALLAAASEDLDVPSSFSMLNRNTETTLKRVEDAFEGYAQGLIERYEAQGKKKQPAKEKQKAAEEAQS